MVKLGEAGGQLAAAGTRSGHDHDRPFGLDVLIRPVTLGTDDCIDVGGVTLGHVVIIDLDAAVFEAGAELLGGVLSAKRVATRISSPNCAGHRSF